MLRESRMKSMVILPLAAATLSEKGMEENVGRALRYLAEKFMAERAKDGYPLRDGGWFVFCVRRGGGWDVAAWSLEKPEASHWVAGTLLLAPDNSLLMADGAESWEGDK